MKLGLIAPGYVDTRSIREIEPYDLKGFTQCHFFAGIGVWSFAARNAGWPDDRPLWTGSCPCQPFSLAGRQKGAGDSRHLWPDFFRLIAAKRPLVIMGEQVGHTPGYGWFDGVLADLEIEDYAGRAVDIPACAVNSPQQRSRLYWCAVVDREGERWGEGRAESELFRGRGSAAGTDAPGDMGDGDGERLSVGESEPGDARSKLTTLGRTDDASHGKVWRFYLEHEWIACHDGKKRRAKPGTSMLVDGFAGRVPIWASLGNAIHAGLAEEVIRAYLDAYGPPPTSASGCTNGLAGALARNGAARRIMTDVMNHA